MAQDDASTFTIMVASDVHLGYLEKDPVRGEDSFLAFEEVLKEAKEREVVVHPCSRGRGRAGSVRITRAHAHALSALAGGLCTLGGGPLP